MCAEPLQVYACRLYWISQYDYFAGRSSWSRSESSKSLVSYPSDTTCLRQHSRWFVSRHFGNFLHQPVRCAHSVLIRCVLLICGHLFLSAPSSFSTLHQLVLVWSARSNSLSALWWPAALYITSCFSLLLWRDEPNHPLTRLFLEWTEWWNLVASWWCPINPTTHLTVLTSLYIQDTTERRSLVACMAKYSHQQL